MLKLLSVVLSMLVTTGIVGRRYHAHVHDHRPSLRAAAVNGELVRRQCTSADIDAPFERVRSTKEAEECEAVVGANIFIGVGLSGSDGTSRWCHDAACWTMYEQIMASTFPDCEASADNMTLSLVEMFEAIATVCSQFPSQSLQATTEYSELPDASSAVVMPIDSYDAMDDP